MTSAYIWAKTLHLVFVIAWMASVFYLPRILVNIAEAGANQDVINRLVLMGKRLYRFGHLMFGIAFIFGLVLMLYFKISGGWLHAKLALVAVLFAYYIVTGRWVKGIEKGKPSKSAKTLRLFNELPVLILLVIVFLVIGKPF